MFKPNPGFEAIDAFLFPPDEEEVPNPFRNEQHSSSQAETQTPEHDVAVITAADEPLHHLHISSVEATKELISCLQEDALKRYTWHSNGLLWTDFTRYTCGSIVRSYKLLLYARHPALTAVRNTLQDFTLGYLDEDVQNNTYLRKEQFERFKEKIFTKDNYDKVLQQITAYGQREKNNAEALQKELREVLRELVVVIMSSWGVAERPAQKFAEDFFVERFDYDNVMRKLALTSMGKLYLPFWTAAIVSLGVVTYVYMQRLILQLAESYFMHDKLVFFNHVNPDYYGRLAVACLETSIYDSSTWEEKRSLLAFIMDTQVSEHRSTALASSEKLVQSYLRRFDKAKNEYNSTPYFLVDPLEVVGDGPALVIFSHLDLFSLLRVGAVCKNWRVKSLNEELWNKGAEYGASTEMDGASEAVPTVPRFPPTHRGRALHEMRNAILVRKSIYFEVKLKSLLCGTPFDEVRKDISMQRKKKIKVLIRKVGALSEKAGVSKETGQKMEMEGERLVDKWLSWDPWILQIPPSMKGKEDIITVVFASNEFGHISIDFVLRVEAATEMNKMTMPGLQTLSTGHVQLDDVLRHCLNWDGVCPLFANGPRIQPIIYVEPFLRFIETNFWSKWWRKGARKLTLNNYLNFTWTYAPPPASLNDSGAVLLQDMKEWAQERKAAEDQRGRLSGRKAKTLLVEAEEDGSKAKTQQPAVRRESDAELKAKAGGGVEALFSITDIVVDAQEKEELRKLLAEDEGEEEESKGDAAPVEATKDRVADATAQGSDASPTDEAVKRKIDWRKQATLQCGQSMLYVDEAPAPGADGEDDLAALMERNKVKAKEMGTNVGSVTNSKGLFVMERIDWIEELFVLRAAGSGRNIKVNLNGDLTVCDEPPSSPSMSTYVSTQSSASTSASFPTTSLRVSSATSSLSPQQQASRFMLPPTSPSFTESITSFSTSIASSLTATFNETLPPLITPYSSIYFYFDSAYSFFDEERIFRRERQDRKTFAFKSYYTGKYLTIEPDGRVSAASDDIGPRQKFQVSYK